jgi:undecaprenyl-diphosphatase
VNPMLWVALTLGVVEGLTEFLPVSSTGHMILVSSVIEHSLPGLRFGGARAQVFEIFIQIGAILAVVFEFRTRLLRLVRDLPRSAKARTFAGQILLAFVPLALLGFVFHEVLFRYLFRPPIVAAALIAGALLIFVVESLPLRARVHSAEDTSWGQAALIGVAQCLALWPGFSRSAATILGGLVVGMDRRAATEFTFFLAIPTLGAAGVYELIRARDALAGGDLLWLFVAFGVSFVIAWLTIRWLLRYVSTHSFKVFAWYRLVLGLSILLWLGSGR